MKKVTEQRRSRSERGTTSRREFLKAALAGAAAMALRPGNTGQAWAADVSASTGSRPATQLSVVRRSIEVNGRAADVYGIRQPDGTSGIRLRAGDPFDVVLRNEIAEPTIVHWHGLTPPWASDGVPDAPMPMIGAGMERRFNFPVRAPGTYWMHAHSLQEQQLLAAPLIVADPGQSGRDEQEVVLMLHDFSFTSPQEILAGLTRNGKSHASGHEAVPPDTQSASHAHDGGMTKDSHDMPGMEPAGSMSAHGVTGASATAMDLNDIEYDAYLANDRTLDDPEVIKVERGGKVRVRVINGATATAFTVDFGSMGGTLTAVDGRAVKPVSGRRFPVSMGQRIDVQLTLPRDARAFPILALREGSYERTGVILQVADAPVGKLAEKADVRGPVLDLALESRLRAMTPLSSRRPGKAFNLVLTGDMAKYQWGLEMQPRIAVDRGDRVEVTMRNTSMMAHPMHLHGHHFQVVAIDGRRFPGALRDTVLVPPGRSVTVAIDADNVGQWAIHCHHLYHMATGMMTTFAYKA